MAEAKGAIDPETGLLRPEVAAMLKKRADEDPTLKRMKDQAKVMSAAPLVAGVSEASQVLGGGALNMNPLLAWASGLPGAPKNLGAIAQANPHRSPSEILQGLMAMGNQSNKAGAAYLNAKNNFTAQQMGTPIGAARRDPVEVAIEKDRLINQPRRASDRAEAAAIRAEDRRIARKNIDDRDDRRKQERADAYLEGLEKWEEKEISPLIEPLENLSESFKRDPSTGTFEIDMSWAGLGKKVIPLNAFSKWITTAEASKFYSDVEAVMAPIRNSRYGGNLTEGEASKALQEFGLGNVTPMSTFLSRLRDIRAKLLRDNERRQRSGVQRFGYRFSDNYDPYYIDRMGGITFEAPTKKGSARPAAAPAAAAPAAAAPAAAAPASSKEIDDLKQKAEALNRIFKPAGSR